MRDNTFVVSSLKAELATLRQRVAELERHLAEYEQLDILQSSLNHEKQYLLDPPSFILTSLDDFPCPIEVYQSDGRLIGMNHLVEALFGLQRSKVVGIYNVFHDPIAYENGYRAAIEQAFAGQAQTLPPRKYNISYYQALRDKQRSIWFETRCFPLRNSAGNISHVIVEFNDVTDKIQIEDETQRLTTELRIFKGLVDHSLDGICMLDVAGIIAYANPALRGMTGYSKTIIGMQFGDLLDESTEILTTFTATLQTHRFWQGELSCRRVNGTIFPALVSIAAILDADHQLLAYAGVLANMTQRTSAEVASRESEARYHNVSRLMSDFAYSLQIKPGGKCRIEWITDAFTRITGYTPDEIMTSDGIRNIVHSSDQDIVRQSIRQVCKGEAAVTTFRIMTKEGAARWLRVHAQPEQDMYQHYVERVFGVAQDITEQKYLESQFIQAQKMDGMGRLAGGVAHDFSNLLVVISGCTELASIALPMDSPVQNELNEIQRAVERATKLTRQLLTFARRQVTDPQIINLNELIHGMDQLLRRLIREDIMLMLSLAQNLWTVRGDTGQIEQVIINLVINARDAMPNGGQITIETTNIYLDQHYASQYVTITPGSYVLLAVTDTGVGMDDEVKQHIFEPFFTTKKTGQGTGLGLATSYGIVQQHGGDIWVYSEVDHGTCIKIYLPRNMENSVVAQEDTKVEQLPQGWETVLLVEDEAAVRELAARILRTQGYYVLEASQGDEALAIVAAHGDKPLHVLITDVIMPEMGGQLVANTLREQLHTLKVLFISGYTDTTIHEYIQLNKDTGYLQKPFTPLGLARKVRALLDDEQK